MVYSALKATADVINVCVVFFSTSPTPAGNLRCYNCCVGLHKAGGRSTSLYSAGHVPALRLDPRNYEYDISANWLLFGCKAVPVE